jgi:hypothetical protein
MTQTRAQAIAIIEEGHDALDRLLDDMDPSTLIRPGLGGGDWSPKDLIGHIASWEEHASEALDSWDRNQPAQVNRDLRALGTDDVNARAVAAWALLDLTEVRSRADASHSRLVRRIDQIGDERWSLPPTPRGRRPMSERLGSILGGPGGDFRHADAHLPDLEEFAVHGG